MTFNKHLSWIRSVHCYEEKSCKFTFDARESLSYENCESWKFPELRLNHNIFSFLTFGSETNIVIKAYPPENNCFIVSSFDTALVQHFTMLALSRQWNTFVEQTFFHTRCSSKVIILYLSQILSRQTISSSLHTLWISFNLCMLIGREKHYSKTKKLRIWIQALILK